MAVSMISNIPSPKSPPPVIVLKKYAVTTVITLLKPIEER